MTSAQRTGSLGNAQSAEIGPARHGGTIALAGDADEAKRLILQSMALETPSKIREETT
jgi:hypothetical protein